MELLFHRLKLTGLLSFGPEGVDLPMGRLNVLIGPNGSGKSNLLEALALFQGAPRDLSEAFSRLGGAHEWLWMGPAAHDSVAMEAVIDFPPSGTLSHSLQLVSRNGRALVTGESINPTGAPAGESYDLAYYRPPRDEHAASTIMAARSRAESSKWERGKRSGERGTWRVVATPSENALHIAEDYKPEKSLISLFAIPDYPGLMYLNERYSQIYLYRNWSFGPGAKYREPCDAHARSDFLGENAENLPLMLSLLRGDHKRDFISSLCKLFHGVVDIQCPVTGGTVSLFLEEEGGRSIPAARLSDGTLRYLCLLAILTHPDPPPLICIEEPELGLHPDLLPTLSDLMAQASQRSQIVVTTHSDILVDTLTDRPESVVVCEKHDGSTTMRRLDRRDLAKWLEEYRLGELWTSGELGGTRW